MNARRIIGPVLATALAATSLGVVATAAAPAQAATTVETRIVPGSDTRPVLSSYSNPLTYGDSISVYADVEAFVNGNWTDISNGSVTLTEQVVGSATASTVASGTSAYVSDSIPARGNAVYTVNYGGGTNYNGSIVYAPSTAAYSVTGVQRAFDITPKSGKKLGLAGKVKPAGKTKLTVVKKTGKKWKKFKSVKTKANGKFMVRLPAPRKRGAKIFWRIDVKGNSQFAASKSRVYYTTKY